MTLSKNNQYIAEIKQILAQARQKGTIVNSHLGINIWRTLFAIFINKYHASVRAILKT